MSADDEAAEGPAVELGDGPEVAGAPIARVTSRLHYGIEKSEVLRRAGDVEVRTPDGPVALSEILDPVEATYFGRRQDLEAAVRETIGAGPVPTDE